MTTRQWLESPLGKESVRELVAHFGGKLDLAAAFLWGFITALRALQQRGKA
jgi:hypothetical protein